MIRFDDDAPPTARPAVTEALADKAGRIGAKPARVTKTQALPKPAPRFW